MGRFEDLLKLNEEIKFSLIPNCNETIDNLIHLYNNNKFQYNYIALNYYNLIHSIRKLYDLNK